MGPRRGRRTCLRHAGSRSHSPRGPPIQMHSRAAAKLRRSYASHPGCAQPRRRQRRSSSPSRRAATFHPSDTSLGSRGSCSAPPRPARPRWRRSACRPRDTLGSGRSGGPRAGPGCSRTPGEGSPDRSRPPEGHGAHPRGSDADLQPRYLEWQPAPPTSSPGAATAKSSATVRATASARPTAGTGSAARSPPATRPARRPSSAEPSAFRASPT